MMKARNKYVPPSILKQLDIIKRENNINSDKIAFDKISKYCEVGMHVEVMRDRLVGIDILKRRRRN